MSIARRLEAIWDRDGFGARMLSPLAWAFGATTVMRNFAYDRGMLAVHALGLPSVSVGNLSVGGTGKTPMSAWTAQRLLALGARPGILLRGYGGDEPLVHARLTPAAVVVSDPDRVRGAATARAHGATALVLDDAFQHRRARRDVDLVLVSAEQGGAHRLLPAGPLRERASSLRRAHALVVTRKVLALECAQQEARRWGSVAPEMPVVIAALQPGGLQAVGAVGREPSGLPLAALDRREVLAISAIGAPGAFETQLRSFGARVHSAAYPDHHAFRAADLEFLARRAAGVELVVCTLKDAVKLEEGWPRQAPPLWYLSQAVVIEQGSDVMDTLLGRLATAPHS